MYTPLWQMDSKDAGDGLQVFFSLTAQWQQRYSIKWLRETQSHSTIYQILAKPQVTLLYTWRIRRRAYKCRPLAVKTRFRWYPSFDRMVF